MLLAAGALFCARALAAPPASLRGDADCDGLVTPADIDHLRNEFADGDGDQAGDVDGGAVVSCSGADANGDGLISAPDLLALTRILYGEIGSSGPIITFLGIASADGTTTMPVTDVPVLLFQTITGLGFHLVVEAAPGPSNLPVGQDVLRSTPTDPDARPDLQAEVSRNLGNGNLAVCGEGGVPGVAPANYGPDQEIANALNDLSCRFEVAANPSVACTIDQFGAHRFVDPRTRIQFCLAVSAFESFPQGLTIVTARVLDTAGNPGPVAQMVLRVGEEPLPTATPRPTATATTSAPASPTATATAEDTPTGMQVATGTATPSGTRSSTGTVTRTYTAGPSPTPTRTNGATRTPTVTSGASRTRTGTSTRTSLASRTPTRTQSATPSATRSGTVPSTATPSVSRTPTITRTPTVTRRPSVTGTPTATPSITRTGTVTRTGTPTRTPTITRTPSRTGTSTRTPTVTRTPTITKPPTQTGTPTATGRPGADITFVGLARADSTLLDPIGVTSQQWPIYERQLGYLFTVVVEAKPGPSRQQVGLNAFRYDAGDPSVRSDIEIIVSRPLGDGSLAVCDNMLPMLGGVPAAASFDLTQPISNAINDFACRFVNGSGTPGGRAAGEACTLFGDGEFRFARSNSTVQFCAGIAQPFGFTVGDTVVSVRARDISGIPGPPASFVVRVRP